MRMGGFWGVVRRRERERKGEGRGNKGEGEEGGFWEES